MKTRLLRWCVIVVAVYGASHAWAQAPATVTLPNAGSSQLEAPRSAEPGTRRLADMPRLVLRREEIERYGDFNVLDVLKRLPSVVLTAGNSSINGTRLRGVANGFTTVLIDERAPPVGFSLETLPTDQVERIEILSAPSAAADPRNTAGTVNIVLRESVEAKVSDLRALVEHSRAGTSPRLSWSGNLPLGNWTNNASVSAFRRQVETEELSTLRRNRVSNGALVADDSDGVMSTGRQTGLTLSSRSIWRGPSGQRFDFRPSYGETRTDVAQTGRLSVEEDDSAQSGTPGRSSRESRTRNWGVESLYAHALAAARVQWRAFVGALQSRTVVDRTESAASATARPNTSGERVDFKDRSAQLSVRSGWLTRGGHGIDTGLEWQRASRRADGATIVNDRPYDTRYDDDLRASVDRIGLFAQDEFALSPTWAAQIGVRADRIKTRAERDRNRSDGLSSTIVSPALHLRWRAPTTPDQLLPAQVRLSLTRSHKAAELNQLVGNPVINRYYRPGTRNTELNLDFGPNSVLRPEKSWNADLAYERYFDNGVKLGANVFHRRIDDLVRNTVQLESVPWAPQLGRYISRPRNIGKATASGIEFDARVRIPELIDGGPDTTVRANVSVLRSRVRNIPGPDNRLIDQPKGSAHLGFNHRIAGTPLSFGAGVTHTPGYHLQLETNRAVAQTRTTEVDAYALWTVDSNTQVRLTVANALARDKVRTTDITTSPIRGAPERQIRTVNQRSDTVVGLRLEMRL